MPRTDVSGKRSEVLILAIPGIVVLVAVAGILWATGFDGLYGQDAFAYYDYAVGPLRSSLLRGDGLAPSFWPPGYPLLLLGFTLLTGTAPSAGQWVSLLAACLVAVFTGLLARELWTDPGERPARWLTLLAGLLAALNGQLWQSSIMVTSDTSALAAVTIGTWALARYGHHPRVAWLGLAAGAVAWAVVTRWAYALVALPCLALALIEVFRQPDRRSCRQAVGVAALAVLIGASPLWAPVLSDLTSGRQNEIRFVGDFKVQTWNPQNALRRDFFTSDGQLHYRLPNGLYYAVAPARWFYLTPIIAPFMGLGLIHLYRNPSAARWLLLVAWPLTVYGFHAGAPWQIFRFTLAYLPPLAILAALGLSVSFSSRRFKRLVVLVCVVGMAAMLWSAGNLALAQVRRKEAHMAVVRWTQTQVPRNATLVTFGLTATFRHYASLDTRELYDLTDTDLERLLHGDRPVFLLLESAGFERQWSRMRPGRNYRLLRDGGHLLPRSSRAGYDLYAIR